MIVRCGRGLDSHRRLQITLDVTRNSDYLFDSDSQLSRQENQRLCFRETGQGIFRIRTARLKLDRMEAATSLRDLAALPGNRFEALVGDRTGQYSIRINDQWRICFEWADREPGPSNVEIVEYH